MTTYAASHVPRPKERLSGPGEHLEIREEREGLRAGGGGQGEDVADQAPRRLRGGGLLGLGILLGLLSRS
jgi:hypothetical protein